MGRLSARRGLAILPIILAGCTELATLNTHSTATDLGSCSQLSDLMDDRNRADPAQLALIREAKEHYRRGEYGLAEQTYRKATEEASFGANSNSRVAMLEAWYGLAASYDELRRFDLADPIYAHIRKTYGESVTYYNNYGYSLELRGDKAAARAEYNKAIRLAPDCQISRNNLKSLNAN